MQLQPVDPCDGAAFAEWFAVVEAVMEHQRPGDHDWTRQDLRAVALRGRPAPAGERPPPQLVDLLVARADGRAVGAAHLERPTRENLGSAFLWVSVLPTARRRGVGRALLAAVADRAAADGRATLIAELDEADFSRRSPGRAFAAATGFTCALEEVRRDLAVPVDAARLDALEAAARPHAAGYDVVTWVGRCPDALAEDRAALARTMSVDVPLGDLQLEAEVWDVDRLRDAEDLVRDQGRVPVSAGAVHRATGRLVGYTDLHAPVEGDRAFQWDTLVTGAHRGHRLGLLVKVAALRVLGDRFPAVRRISTWNEKDNTHMIAVNEALGYVVAGLSTEWQRPV